MSEGSNSNWDYDEKIEFPDPAAADDYVVEYKLREWLTSTSTLTEKFIEVSAERAAKEARIEELVTAVTRAYVYGLSGDLDKMMKILDKVID